MSELRKLCDTPKCEGIAQKEYKYIFTEGGNSYEKHLCGSCFKWLVRGWYKYPNGTRIDYIQENE